MSAHLDLDDVAAQSPLAMRELQELQAENERLRAENWRLRSLLNMWSATFAEFFVPGTLGGDLLVATRAELAKYSRNAAEPNDQHNRTPDQGVPG